MGPASTILVSVSMFAGRIAPSLDQADAEDDEDFGVEDGELQDTEAISVMQTESVFGLPMLAPEDIRVEVIYDDILAMDKALQVADGAFTEVGKHNRGQLAGRGNSHGVDATQSPRVNLKDIVVALVGNHNQTVKHVTFSPRVTHSRRGAR
ncbi:hypothetical protein NE237_008773 [Protea cynaroides]|uniref:Uncharacterized protein n=1 Tax=Protea cynaroides TaxID=273540 RepID=A0A9Q0KW68_9MAGN|nr:hypothetical protein NE237_008773 [Protea cynaroides]